MPSGKQILLSVLGTYSQQRVDPTNQSQATDRLKAALLLHGSTAEETLAMVDRVQWLCGDDVQEVGVGQAGISVLDIVEALVGDWKMPDHVAREFSGLSQEDYEAAVFVVWALVSQVRFLKQLSPVENGGRLDEEESERLIAGYRQKLALYRENPDAFVGRK